MRLHLASALALALLSTAGISSQTALQQPSPYTRTVWRVSDGLPEDTVQSLIESSQGQLWIGTTGGLAQFDGSNAGTAGQKLGARTIQLSAKYYF